MPNLSMQLFIDAVAFAATKHRMQRRKDVEASPYINHPIALAHVLAFEAKVSDEHVLIASILHDTLEDTETSFEELRERFGLPIAETVAEVTDDKTLSKLRRKALQIEHAPHLSKHAKLVKLADKICNLRDVASSPPKDWPLQRRREYFDWAKQVVDGLRGVHPRLEAIFDEAYADRP
jgi:GTP diphosphokinase / guanosine-3',5'-bis(diphosphate) 3'-diphosphatase